MKTLLLLVSILAAGAFAAEAPKPSEPKPAAPAPATPKPYPLKTCIVSDNDLDSMGEQTSIVHEGRVIKFCCQPCVAKFQKNPAKYLPKIEEKPAKK
jgi:YHS domain-containing protein